MFGPRSLHSFTLVHPATARAFRFCNFEGGHSFIKAVVRASQPLAGLGTRIWSKFSLPVGATWVALRKTLLRTNGSHGRCTIYFARLIFRPFICLWPSFKAMLRFENLLFVLPKTLQRFTFDSLRPAMRSPSSRRPRFIKRFALSRVWHPFNPSY